jgi:hypothetical protein
MKLDAIDYRCKSCGEIVPRGTHHKMTSCKCGKVHVDRGWYGSRVLWPSGSFGEAVEIIKPASVEGSDDGR